LLYTPTASKIILAAKESGMKKADELIIDALCLALQRSKLDTRVSRLVPIPSSKLSQRRRGRSFIVDLVKDMSHKTGIEMIDCLELSQSEGSKRIASTGASNKSCRGLSAFITGEGRADPG
jgi:predicted amidophosphoribosyltransferase